MNEVKKTNKQLFEDTEALRKELARTKEALESKEKELNEAKAKLESFKKVIDAIPHHIHVKNLDSRFLLANKSVAESFSMSPEKLAGKRHSDLAADESEMKQMLADDREVIESGRTKFIPEETYTDKQGRVHWLQTLKIPFNDFGEPGVLVIAVDITELKESEEKFKVFMNNLNASAFIKDHNSTFLYCNDYMEALFGARSWIGKNAKDYLPADIAAQILEDDRSVLEKGPKVVKEVIPLKSGERRLFETRKFLIERLGKKPLLGAVSIDIHDREKAFRDLEDLNIRKDRFFSIIAHDLKNPFIGFMGLAETLSKNFNELTIDEMGDIAKSLFEASNRLLRLLSNLLDWSKSQLGTMPVKKEKINLRDLINDKLSLLRLNAQEKLLDIQVFVPSDYIVIADPNMLSSIISNLLSNAIKYNKKHGKLDIKIEDLKGFHRINIEDTGIGIKPKYLDDIFSIDGSYLRDRTVIRRGSGLGLILCKEFISRQGGEIIAESEYGKGSRFSFTLPKGEI